MPLCLYEMKKDAWSRLPSILSNHFIFHPSIVPVFEEKLQPI